jgi:CRISPR system Cascade subunit CasA
MVLNKTQPQPDKAHEYFNLIENPWIPVRLAEGGRHALLGLDEIFRKADAIEDLDCAPHERIALMRLLVCITHAALGAPESPEEWQGFGSEIATKVPAYLNRAEIKPHFNLLGDGPRFLQVPISSAKEAVDITKLVFHLATGNNPTLLDHEGGSEGRSLSPDRAAMALLTFQNYYPPYGAGHKGKGPCVDRNMIHTLLEGKNLAQTILQNCLSRDVVAQHFPDFGTPIWELKNDAHFERLATSTYLGRLVPRHRTILLNEQLTGFHIDQRGMEYPNFEEARESTSTLKVFKKKDTVERGLVDCKLDRAVWRDLHVFLVIKHARSEEVSAPLNLIVQSRRAVGDIKMWTGGLVTDGKAKIFDAIESTFTIPSAMLGEEGRSVYRAGVEFAETQSFRLKLAVTEFTKAMKSESVPDAKAQNCYWHALDREAPRLLDLAANPPAFGSAEKGNPWGDLVRAAALEAYEATCPRQTPRQIKAFAEGLKKLPIPKPKPQST